MPIVLILSLGVILGVWWIGTRDLDFMTPEGLQAELPVQEEMVIPETGPAPGVVIEEEIVSGEVEKPKEEIELGDLQATPGLFEYLEVATQGVDRLFALAEKLEEKGENERALLAYERVIDATQASPEELEKAAKKVKELSPDYGFWVFDPRGRKQLTLNLGTARSESEDLRDAGHQLVELVTQSSGGQIELFINLQTADPTDAVPQGPIALWISEGEESSVNTSVLSITPGPESQLVSEIALGVYRLVRGRLVKEGYPAEQLAGRVPPLDLIDYHLTRRMWADFLESMKTQESVVPPLGDEVIVAEPTDPEE